MQKKRLSKNQQRRIEHNHRSRWNADKESKTQNKSIDETQFTSQQTGLVITRFGKNADIEDKSKQLCRCDIRRTLPALVTGDQVLWRSNVNPVEKGIIEAILPRKSELVRPDFYDGIKLVAANIDQIFIVASILPELSLNILDRYLVACENTQIKPVIILNKIDLASADKLAEVEKYLDYYRQIGVESIQISCQSGFNLDKLNELMVNKISILVGPSGVGKSSIIDHLLSSDTVSDNQQIQIGEISSVSNLGQHTTTSSRLYHLSNGGDLIDSPGIREFGLWHYTPQQILNGFVEFQQYIGNCKFRDCNHTTDANCGIVNAVKEKLISSWRLDNFYSIIKSNQEIKERTNKRF